MDSRIARDLTYGMFIVSAKKWDKTGGCVINTCIQVSTDPECILISLMNSDYTRDLIKKSGYFCVAILDETTPFELIKHFGFQSGRDVDKFRNIPSFNDIYDNPCVLSNACAYISAKVTESINLGSHTLFVGKVKDSKLLNENRPLTYAEYHLNVKPQPQKEVEKEIVGWRCQICGYIYDGPVLPDDFVCPNCGHYAEDFEPIYKEE